MRPLLLGISNKPIKGATLTFINVYDSSEPQQVRTDANGKYLLETTQEGDYSLYASKPAFAVSSKTMTIAAVTVRPLTLC
jgi:hypothetical protein